MNDRISDLSPDDETWLRLATEHIANFVRSRDGGEEFERTHNDLRRLQHLIDNHAITKENVLEAQCVGVVLGQLFTENTTMRWRRVDNEYGDMIALHDDRTGFTLYPLTMISKRLEDRRTIDLVALYEDLAQSLHLTRPAD